MHMPPPDSNNLELDVVDGAWSAAVSMHDVVPTSRSP